MQHGRAGARIGGLGLLWLVLAGGVSLVPSGARADSRPEETLPRRTSLPNVVLVTVDTTRADHCSCYGYTRSTTPHLDMIAQQGVLFETAYTVTPSTSPAHATLFTSQYPDVHRVLKNGYVLPDEMVTLAEILRGQGYETAAFVSAFPVLGRFGLSQGFDLYDDEGIGDDKTPGILASSDRPTEGVAVPAQGTKGRPQRRLARSGGRTTSRAVRWLDNRHRADPFFLWVHYFDAHWPYLGPQAYHSMFARRQGTSRGESDKGNSRPDSDPQIDVYDGHIRYADDQMKRLLTAVDQAAGSAGTILVVASDHGQGLGDHNWDGHGAHLYEELMRVALVFHWPGHVPPGKRLCTPAGLVDILPTLMSMLGLPAEGSQLQGQDLSVAWKKGKSLPDERPMFMQRRLYKERRVKHLRVLGQKRAVRVGKWKLICAPEEHTTELFDLQQDARELHNVAAQHPEVVGRLKALLEGWQASAAQTADDHQQQMSPEDLERLKALGYVE